MSKWLDPSGSSRVRQKEGSEFAHSAVSKCQQALIRKIFRVIPQLDKDFDTYTHFHFIFHHFIFVGNEMWYWMFLCVINVHIAVNALSLCAFLSYRSQSGFCTSMRVSVGLSTHILPPHNLFYFTIWLHRHVHLRGRV